MSMLPDLCLADECDMMHEEAFFRELRTSKPQTRVQTRFYSYPKHLEPEPRIYEGTREMYMEEAVNEISTWTKDFDKFIKDFEEFDEFDEFDV